MEIEMIEGLGAELKRYMRIFRDCFGRREPKQHALTYVRAQMTDLPRKSVEPMADQAGIDPRALQKFLAQHRWDDGRMVRRIHELVARDHADPHAIGVLDETSFPKKGAKTPGVQRQHCGASGKQDNCTITVHLGYATTPGFHCLLSSALFLPEGWSEDRARCREAGIPDDLVHRPKWQIALELHQQARDQGVHLAWVTADEHYGRPVEFHLEMSRRGQKYIVEVPSNFWAWCRRPKVVEGKRGPRRAEHPPISTAEDLARYAVPFAKQGWTRYYIKDTIKGPVVWEAKAAPIYLKNGEDLPTGAHWLVIARNALNHEQVKYFVSNAPLDTPLETLLHVAFSRWHLERCFEDDKSELGMDHFEVRTYTAMMRHLALTAVSYLFVARQHQALKKNSVPHGLSGSNGGECILDGSSPARSPRIPPALVNNHQDNATAQCKGGAQPPQENATTAQEPRYPDLEVATL